MHTVTVGIHVEISWVGCHDKPMSLGVAIGNEANFPFPFQVSWTMLAWP